jgi:outer membrane protein TolC
MRSSCILGAALLAACAGSPPSIGGAPGAPPQPSTTWAPPKDVLPPAATPATPLVAPVAGPTVTPASLQQLTLADAVDLALRNNPATRISWAQARAAADLYGASKGAWYPTLDAAAAITRSKSVAVPGRIGGERTTYTPSVTLSWLVLDLGGRAANVDAARQTAIAADLSHNSVVQNTILQVQGAVFTYLGTRALRDAQKSALDEANANLAAAEERHRVGLATIADVLQARTAKSQAELDLEALQGQLQVSRGGVAVAMGLPANTAFDIPDVPPADSTQSVTQSIDSLLALAVRTRPDLAEAQAQAQAALAQVRVARSAGLPSLALSATGGYSGSNIPDFSGRTYTLNLGVQIPLFEGFSRLYNTRAAQAQADAAAAHAEFTRQQVMLQVFSSYYALQTAAQRVRTSGDLLASALQSEQVARGRYTEGVGSIVDLLLAQSALASARAQAVQSRWQWRQALAQLAHDAGVLGIHGETLLPLSSDAPGSDR